MKSKLHFVLIFPALLFSFCVKMIAQSPDWLWAKLIGCTSIGCNDSYVSPNSLVVDPGSGDIYSFGKFEGNFDFDPGLDSFYLTSSNFFISKLDGDGNFKWVKGLDLREWSVGWGGASFSELTCIAIDPLGSGDLYLTGYFSDTTDFDPGDGIYNLTPLGESDIFISKLDSAGNFVWAKQVGSTEPDKNFSIAIDPAGSGNIYISGEFEGTVDFDPGPDTFNLNSDDNSSMFISKLDSSGNFIWAKAMGGGEISGYSLALDPENGAVYTTGWYRYTVDFDPGPDTFSLPWLGSSSFGSFICKLDSSGNFVWSKLLENSLDNLVIDPSVGGNVYGLSFKGFFSKLDDSGNLVWTKQLLETTDSYYCTSLAIDPSGSGCVYISGSFQGMADFDPGMDIVKFTSSEHQDLFISKFDGHGNFVWTKTTDGGYYDEITSISPDNLGHVDIMGYFYGYPSPGTISFGSTTLTNLSTEYSSFIAKLDTTLITSFTEIKQYPINIYPNPATNELTVDFKGGNFQEVGITMYNILGEVVLSSNEQYFFYKKTFDISKLTAGVYFIETNIDGETVMKKIVKE